MYMEEEWTAHGWDGCPLHMLVLTPDDHRQGTVICGHAYMVDRRTMWRDGKKPSIAETLLRRGFRVVLPNNRGRPGSGLVASIGGSEAYEDHVEDCGSIVRLVRSKVGRDEPIHLLGHSQFGHVSLAWLSAVSQDDAAGIGPLDVQEDDHPASQIASWVGLGANPWLQRVEPSWRFWFMKWFVLLYLWALSLPFGYTPSKRFRIGSQDESLLFARSFWRMWWTDSWRGFGPSAFGPPKWTTTNANSRKQQSRPEGLVSQRDYWVGQPKVAQPCLVVLSEGDRKECRPLPACRFSGRLQRREIMFVVAPERKDAVPAEDLEALQEAQGKRHRIHWVETTTAAASKKNPKKVVSPSHMGMVTDLRSEPAWEGIASWMQEQELEYREVRAQRVRGRRSKL